MIYKSIQNIVAGYVYNIYVQKNKKKHDNNDFKLMKFWKWHIRGFIKKYLLLVEKKRHAACTWMKMGLFWTPGDILALSHLIGRKPY